MGCMHYNERRDERAGSRAVPRLRLPGRRLECCGFAVGDALQVTLGNGLSPISRGKGKN
ncbi:alginate O-acetyltransferase [Stenotrophomonas sp. MYb238]|nr:alginate O-acetyltransferase [Stenotrophomonas sp. MYb238]